MEEEKASSAAALPSGSAQPAQAVSVEAKLDIAEAALLSLLESAGHTALALSAFDIKAVDASRVQFMQQAALARENMLQSIEALKAKGKK